MNMFLSFGLLVIWIDGFMWTERLPELDSGVEAKRMSS